ncbi:MAG: TIGR01620 family protein [Hyphomicrobiales bacterium]
MSDEPAKRRKPRVFDLPTDGDASAKPEPKQAAPKPATSKKATPNPKRKAAPKTTAKSARTKTVKEDSQSRPRALELADVELTNQVIDQIDEAVVPTDTPQRRFSWGGVLMSALGALVMLAIGLAVDELVRDLFSRHQWLGWLALALTILVIIATVVLIIRELLALMRLRQIANVRDDAEQAFVENDKEAADKVEAAVTSLYANRIDLASARTAYSAYEDDVIGPADRIRLIETELLSPIDKKAEELVMNAAKRVAIVTAVSPRALVDILYVLAENLRLIRAISELYGGKPGMIGFWRLTKSVVSHLAITGAISIGDGLLQQVVGHGLAARLSARFGEGVINGLLTARIGLAAHDICRPVPFLHRTRPSISKYLNTLVGLAGLSGSDKSK